MSHLGLGIAIAGIWIGAGLTGLAGCPSLTGLSIFTAILLTIGTCWDDFVEKEKKD